MSQGATVAGERALAEPGRGAELSLCAVRIGEQSFGIDTVAVREVLGRADRSSRRVGMAGPRQRHDLRRVPLAPTYVAGVIPYRGEVLTTLSLRALLGGEQEMSGGCVLVLDGEAIGELLGLMVDEVCGVVTVRESMREENPCTLDARARALFDGVYKMPTGLMARIDLARLRPGWLKSTGLFEYESEGRRSRPMKDVPDDREHPQG